MAVEVSDEALRIVLSDGRELSAQLARFPRLGEATPEQRRRREPIGLGDGIDWPEIDWPEVDEDVSVWALMGWPT